MSKKPAKRAGRTPAKKPAKKASKKPARKSVKKSPAKAAGARAVVRRSADFMRFARKVLDDMTAGIPDDRACEQLPGLPNHKLWTYGHLAATNSWIASLIDGKPQSVPESYQALFGMSSKPTYDVAAYPSLDEVREAYRATFNRLVAAFESLSDDRLASPPKGDGAGFINDMFDAALKSAWHEGWHLGQMALLRKGLGAEPLFKS